MRFIFLAGDGFDLFEGRQFVEAGLVVEDVIQEILQVLLVKRLLQLAEQFLALVDDGYHRVSHTNRPQLLLQLEVITSLGPHELEWLPSKLKTNFLYAV